MEASNVSLDDLAGVHAHRVHHELRERGPVVWVPAIDGWLIVGREEAIEALRDAERFTVDDERFSTAVVVGTSMLSTDGTAHARHRRPFVAPFLRPQADQHLTPVVRELAGDLVDRLRPAGRADLRTDLAGPLAVACIVDALGLVGTSVGDVLAWYRAIVAGVDRVSTNRGVESSTTAAVASLRACVATTVAAGHGPLRTAADSLDADEVFSNTAVLMFGAIETSEGMTANALWHLLRDRDLLQVVERDRASIGDLVEESLRLEPAAAVVDRYATCDTTLGGALITAGEFVRVSLAGANRDPGFFDEPDTFELLRHNARQHLTFVQGPHVCIGLHLARAQTAAAISAVLDRLPGLVLDDDLEAPTGLIFRKPRHLGARWSTAS